MSARARLLRIRNNIIPAFLVGGIPGALCVAAAALVWLAVRRAS